MNLKKGFILTTLIAVAALMVFATVAVASDFKIAIMQDAPKDAQTFKPVLDYLKKNGINAEFVTAPNYSAAAQMFGKGEVNAMFSGSGVAGAMIIKGLATPSVRPVFKDDSSTYWAVVLAPKGSPNFTSNASYFKGKKVVYCGLASAGEFFFRSIEGAPAAVSQIIPAPNHFEAINILNRGQADIAIVKNRVWDKNAGQFPGIAMVGEDNGENPDRTLIISKKTPQATNEKVTAALLALRADTSSEAEAVKTALNIRGFSKATAEDFSHTLTMLKKAGVSSAFDFKY